MIVLDATTKSLEVDLVGAVTTNQLPFVATYVDVTTTTYVPGSSDGTTNSTTAVTLVAAPGASTQRQVKFISVQNADTVSATITIQLNNNSTLRTIFKATIAASSTLIYTDGEGFRILDSSGNILYITGSAGAGLLSTSTHNDVVDATVSRGSLIYGNSTPKWDELVVGSANRLLRSDGTDIAWNQVALATDVTGDLPFANLVQASGASVLVGRGSAAGAGDFQEISLGTGLSMSGTTLSGGSGAMELLYANSGTNTDAAATTIDSFALSGLTAKDTVIVYWGYESATQQTTTPRLYHVTDAASFPSLNGGAVAAGVKWSGFVELRQAQPGNTLINFFGIATDTAVNIVYAGDQVSVTTAWTASWTLGLRHGGVTSGGTFKYSWAVYRIKGQ